MNQGKGLVTRRSLLQVGALGFGSALLAACSQSAPAASPTTAPSAGAGAASSSSSAQTAATPASAQSGSAAAPATKPTVAAASAAAPAASTSGGAAPSGSIVFMDGINSYSKLCYQWAQEFSAATPSVKVQVNFIADGTQMVNQLLVQAAGGTPPDVFTFFQEIIPIDAAVERNLLFPIDDLIKRDNLDMSDFLPQAVNLNRWQGKLYALPRDYGNQQVYYNVDMFKKKGVPLPGTDWTDTTWTFDKYLEAAKALTETTGGKTTQWGILTSPVWRVWASFVYSNGGTVVKSDSNGVANAISLTDDAAVAGMQYLQDLIYKEKVAPEPAASTDLGPVDFFGTNKVGMLIGNPTQVTQFRAIKAFTWDVAPLPLGKTDKRGSGGGGTAWGMAKAGKNPDAAWALLKYITTAKAQLQEVAIGATTPSRSSVVNSTEFLSPTLPPKNSKSFAQAQGYVVRDPVNINWPTILSKVVTPNIQLLFGGKNDAKTVAQMIKTQADPMWGKT